MMTRMMMMMAIIILDTFHLSALSYFHEASMFEHQLHRLPGNIKKHYPRSNRGSYGSPVDLSDMRPVWILYVWFTCSDFKRSLNFRPINQMSLVSTVPKPTHDSRLVTKEPIDNVCRKNIWSHHREGGLEM